MRALEACAQLQHALCFMCIRCCRKALPLLSRATCWSADKHQFALDRRGVRALSRRCAVRTLREPHIRDVAKRCRRGLQGEAPLRWRLLCWSTPAVPASTRFPLQPGYPATKQQHAPPQNVGPATACECGHRYREHATDSLSGQRHPKVRLALYTTPMQIALMRAAAARRRTCGAELPAAAVLDSSIFHLRARGRPSAPASTHR